MSIRGVIHESRRVDHEDHRRALFTIFNGDLGEFVAKQVKIVVMKEDAVLGGHFHYYDELYHLLEGCGAFILKDTATEIIEQYDMIKGDQLFIPKRVAHKANLKAGSILIGCTQEPYVSPEYNNQKYEF